MIRSFTAPEYVVSVSRLANYLARKLARDAKLQYLGVSGEISNYSPQPGGHAYFDLKDSEAVLKCVVWSEAAANAPPLANGQAIVAIGALGTYARRGTYQLTVLSVEYEGAGRLHARYEALKRRLEADGLFAQSRKRSLPPFPFRIALVSSRAANGAGDFLAQAAAHAPHVSIALFETPVQGEHAAPEIVRALGRASRAEVDLIVLARGGGSYEDLFVFNDERVVRALANCAHPTVSAIGHEADAPLTDFVADRREPTPTSAARNVLPRRADLLRAIADASSALGRCIGRTIEGQRRELARVALRSPLSVPQRMFAAQRQTLDLGTADLWRASSLCMQRRQRALALITTRLEACNPSVRLSARRERFSLVVYRLESAERAAIARKVRLAEAAAARLFPATLNCAVRQRSRLVLASALLEARDPTKILQRGYAIVTADGRAIRDAAKLATGQTITARLARGSVIARVESVRDDGGE